MSIFKSAIAAAVAATATLAAQAHHSYASFEMDRVVEISGTVVKWEWTNPHTFLYVTVVGKDGATAEYEVEGTSPSMLGEVGFTRKTFAPGDKVTVSMHPHRSKPNFGAFSSAKLPNGKVMSLGLPGPRGPNNPNANIGLPPAAGASAPGARP